MSTFSNKTIELSMLGLFYQDPTATIDQLMSARIDPDAFLASEYKPVFDEMFKLFVAGNDITENSLRIALNGKGHLLDSVLKLATEPIDRKDVMDKAIRYYSIRQSVAAMTEYSNWLRGDYEKELHLLETKLGAVDLSIQSGIASQHIETGDSMSRFFSKNRRSFTSGYPWLDYALSGGFKPGRLTLLLGSKKSGKTSFQCNVAARRIEANKPCLLVEREFNADQVKHIVVSVMTGISLERLECEDAETKLAATELESVRNALQLIDQYLFINTTAKSVSEIMAWARVRLSDLDYNPETLLQIDHLTLLNDEKGNRASGLAMLEVGQNLHDIINGDNAINIPVPILLTGQIDPIAGNKLNKKGDLGEEEFVAYGGKSPGQWVDEGFVLGLHPHPPDGVPSAVIKQLVSRWGKRANFRPIQVHYDSSCWRFE